MNAVEHAFQEVGHGIKVAAQDTAKVIDWLPDHLVQAEAVVAEAIKEEPAVKQLVLDLIRQSSTLITDAGVDIADKGLNIPQDAKTAADFEAYLKYLKDIFFPQVSALYKEAKALIQ